jgi:hypothetical protein
MGFQVNIFNKTRFIAPARYSPPNQGNGIEGGYTYPFPKKPLQTIAQSRNKARQARDWNALAGGMALT